MADSHIPSVPPPWTLKGEIYAFLFWTSPSQAKEGLPSIAYSPLEGQSSFAKDQKALGGLSMLQLIRYTDSPVGPYDELILAPGTFGYEKEDENGRKVKGKGVKITRIYVSHKHTCYNGRKNWNVPKHLAKFDWINNSNGSTTVKVYPHDTLPTDSASPESASPDPTPFFQATFKPIRYAPSFPFRTSWINFLGFDTTLVFPPLPEGFGSQGELPGTDQWCSVVPQQSTSKCMLGWFDVEQHRGEQGKLTGEFENFWPGWSKWQIGIKMENSVIEFDHPEAWEPPRTRL
ncbi:uncharacterized protein FFUJ_08765 [Fusarium fujikuroi IMI 58289]|uniref:Uncharacterized protein n=1 Tax=Gibberella fujikuroi (strain CBS 195.34 / IMI 58289 / NRRL A-6831) TaxID=1279085 RepID=S0E958_GIBF5|nr:uncharacterized protein FFUJ_08765 [Fusarium fujikuroi IMI 58289]CCT71185.1 uncharacterized protein FFUJ_08765 [Fusarium fujikuroi IMI 58289]SCO01674.1 uncharacterized protein FFM5_07640 [Fusarium fujikuroi]